MRLFALCCFLLLMWCFYACKPSATTSAKKKDTVAKSVNTLAPQITDSTASTDTMADDCPRGASKPFIKMNVFPQARFILLSDHKTWQETLTLADSDQVTIKESGCEYYTLSFRLETLHLAADSRDIPYCCNAALSLLHELDNGLVETPLDMTRMFKNVSPRVAADQATRQHQLKLGEQIDFGGEDFKQFLTINRVTQLADQRYVLEFSMSYGPM